VNRVSPSLEKKKIEKKVSVKKKQARVTKQKEKVQHKKNMIKNVQTIGFEGFNIQNEAKKIWKLLTPYHNGKEFPKIEMQNRGFEVQGERLTWRTGRHAGLAYIEQNKIWLKARPEWETLAHELVHLAVGVRKGVHNRRAHDKVFYDCLRDVCQKRFKVSISFYEVTKYGYIVDRIIEKQLYDMNVYEVFKKKEI
jgi:hypothetical protein